MKLPARAIDDVGNVALSLFLVMALMTLRLTILSFLISLCVAIPVGVRIVNLDTDATIAQEEQDTWVAQQVAALLEEIAPAIDPERHRIISVISGVSIRQLRAPLQTTAPIVRAMPNTAVSIGESMTCLASHDPDDPALATKGPDREPSDDDGVDLDVDGDRFGTRRTLWIFGGLALVMGLVFAFVAGGLQLQQLLHRGQVHAALRDLPGVSYTYATIGALARVLSPAVRSARCSATASRGLPRSASRRLCSIQCAATRAT